MLGGFAVRRRDGGAVAHVVAYVVVVGRVVALAGVRFDVAEVVCNRSRPSAAVFDVAVKQGS
eukprot:6888611-Pyramimonas_sp.AAC.1